MQSARISRSCPAALVPFGPVCLSVSASSARLQDMGGPALFKVNARAADPNCAFTAASADVVSGTLLLGTAGGELTRVSGRDGDILAEAQASGVMKTRLSDR